MIMKDWVLESDNVYKSCIYLQTSLFIEFKLYQCPPYIYAMKQGGRFSKHDSLDWAFGFQGVVRKFTICQSVSYDVAMCMIGTVLIKIGTRRTMKISQLS